MADKKLVAELRRATGVSIMLCSKTLDIVGGDLNKALERLKTAGEDIAAKRASRDTKEGSLFCAYSDREFAILELNCETDFVAKNGEFQDFGNKVIKSLLASDFPSDGNILEHSTDDNQIDGLRESLILKIGENVTVGDYKKFKTDSRFANYVHGAKLISLLEYKAVNGKGSDAAAKIAMHIAGMSPLYLVRPSVDSEFDIPPTAENVLLEQEFILASNQSVGEFAKSVGIELLFFHIFRLGAANTASKWSQICY